MIWEFEKSHDGKEFEDQMHRMVANVAVHKGLEIAFVPATANGAPRPEDFRQYLALLARAHLGPKQRAKVDPSDMVQQTLLDGHCKLGQFRGSTKAEMAAWLRRMLSCNIADAFRALRAQKRDVALERSLEAPLDETCSRLEVWLVAVQTSPSGRACRNEQLLRLAWPMGELPDAQRKAVELHHLHGLSLRKRPRRWIGRRPR